MPSTCGARAVTTGASGGRAEPDSGPWPGLAAALEALIARHKRSGHAPLIGIAGAQGSGKTTLARAVAARIGAAAFSLDDVYLDRAARARLAGEVHPLFAVRGPPLTHDLDLLAATVARLRAAGPGDRTPLPAFDKLTDAPAPARERPVFVGRPAAILIDGWLLGATAQGQAALARPVNELERVHDPDGVWRRAADAALAGPYRAAFSAFDAILFLKAPSFEVVLNWRCEQEAGLLGVAPDALPPRRRAELAVFIRHFERITRHMLAGGVAADVTVALDEGRRPTP